MTTENTTTTEETTEATALGTGSDASKADAATAGAGDEGKKDETAGEGQNETGETDAGKGEGEATGAPEAYDVEAMKGALPEGMEFDAEAFEAVEPLIRDLGLNQEQAQKLVVDGYAGQIVPMIAKRTLEKVDSDAATMRANMARDLKADPVVGGGNYDESVALSAKAIDHYLPDESDRAEFKKFMDESGFGNHPMLMRIIAGAGRALGEADTPIPGANKQEKTASQVFYPNG